MKKKCAPKSAQTPRRMNTPVHQRQRKNTLPPPLGAEYQHKTHARQAQQTPDSPPRNRTGATGQKNAPERTTPPHAQHTNKEHSKTPPTTKKRQTPDTTPEAPQQRHTAAAVSHACAGGATIARAATNGKTRRIKSSSSDFGAGGRFRGESGSLRTPLRSGEETALQLEAHGGGKRTLNGGFFTARASCVTAGIFIARLSRFMRFWRRGGASAGREADASEHPPAHRPANL